MLNFLIPIALEEEPINNTYNKSNIEIVSEISVEKEIKKEKNISPSSIPIQVPISHENYKFFREKAKKSITNYYNQCARLVNRIFLARFGVLMFGDAWDMALKKQNQEYLNLIWKLQEEDFRRDFHLHLHTKEDRIEHYRRLYNVLNAEKNPIGILGFVYYYSSYKDHVAKNKYFLPQTHVAFLAGKKKFFIENETDEVKKIYDILTEKFGTIHDFEEEFLNERIPLSLELMPGSKYYYYDFLIEDLYKDVHGGSLVQMFLRKHRNNKITPLFRPVSYARVSDKILGEMEKQKKFLAQMGNVKFIPGYQFDEVHIDKKDEWLATLEKYFGIKNPRKSILVPIPELIKIAKD